MDGPARWKCPENEHAHYARGVHDLASLVKAWGRIPKRARPQVLLHAYHRLYGGYGEYETWIKLFRDVGFVEIVPSEPVEGGHFEFETHPDEFKRPAHPLRLYRGVFDSANDPVGSLSWTTSLGVARYYALGNNGALWARSRDKGEVFVVDAAPESILSATVTADREWIIDAEHAGEIRLLESGIVGTWIGMSDVLILNGWRDEQVGRDTIVHLLDYAPDASPIAWARAYGGPTSRIPMELLR